MVFVPRRRATLRIPPGPLRSRRERREHAAALALVGGIKVLLSVSLLVAAAQSYLLSRQRLPADAQAMVAVLSLLLGVGALATAVSGWRNLRAARSILRPPLPAPPGDERGEAPGPVSGPTR